MQAQLMIRHPNFNSMADEPDHAVNFTARPIHPHD